MDWPYCDGTVTVVDVLDAGACIGGVKGWVVKNRGKIAGAPGDVRGEHSRRVLLAANADGGGGYGDGYGYGGGYGDGGYGDGGGGYGDGYGDGGGDGYGGGYGGGGGG